MEAWLIGTVRRASDDWTALHAKSTFGCMAAKRLCFSLSAVLPRQCYQRPENSAEEESKPRRSDLD